MFQLRETAKSEVYFCFYKTIEVVFFLLLCHWTCLASPMQNTRFCPLESRQPGFKEDKLNCEQPLISADISLFLQIP